MNWASSTDGQKCDWFKVAFNDGIETIIYSWRRWAKSQDSRKLFRNARQIASHITAPWALLHISSIMPSAHFVSKEFAMFSCNGLRLGGIRHNNSLSASSTSPPHLMTHIAKRITSSGHGSLPTSLRNAISNPPDPTCPVELHILFN